MPEWARLRLRRLGHVYSVRSSRNKITRVSGSIPAPRLVPERDRRSPGIMMIT